MIPVLVIIPTYNESESISSLLNKLSSVRSTLSEKYLLDILFVDDASPDKTGKKVESAGLDYVTLHSREKKMGLGPAYIEGFSLGLAKNYQFFIQMDADLSHNPEEIGRLLEEAAEGDIVIGTRWMPGGSVENWPFYRRLISKIGTKYASIMLQLPYNDLTSGFRVLPRQLFKTINFKTIKTKGYGFQIEIILKAVENGFKIKQVPINFIERENGRSKMGPHIVWEALYKVSLWGIKKRLIRR